MKTVPAEQRAVYRAAVRWGEAGVKWKTDLGAWAGTGAVHDLMMPTPVQEIRIRRLLGMNDERYERWNR